MIIIKNKDGVTFKETDVYFRETGDTIRGKDVYNKLTDEFICSIKKEILLDFYCNALRESYKKRRKKWES